MEIIFRYAERFREIGAFAPRRLRAEPKGVFPGFGIVRGDTAARLDRQRRHPPMPDMHRKPTIRRRELTVGFAEGGRGGERGVRAKLRVNERRIRVERCHCADDRRQRLVIHLDGINGVAREVAVRRNDRRDGFAGETHDAFCERRVLRDLEVPRDRDTADIAEIIGGDHGDDARHRTRDIDVDAPDTGMGIGAVQKRDVRQIGDRSDRRDTALPRRASR